jgi:hypothetical protein
MYGINLVSGDSKEQEILKRIAPILDEYNVNEVFNVMFSMFIHGIENFNMDDRRTVFDLIEIAKKQLLFKTEGVH